MSDVATSAPYGVTPYEKGSSSYRIKRYRQRAEELRTIADDLLHPECQRMLERLADSYDAMADREEPRH